jgi:hypothetical protein
MKAKANPHYLLLNVGDLLVEGDECFDDLKNKWGKTCNFGKVIGHCHTLDFGTGKPFPYRRKIG